MSALDMTSPPPDTETPDEAVRTAAREKLAARRAQLMQDVALGLRAQDEPAKLQQEQLDRQQQQHEQRVKTQLPLSVADMMQWQNAPQYQTSWAHVPEEARQHFISGTYEPEIAAQAPEQWNRSIYERTGTVPGTEGMTAKQATVDPETGKAKVTYVPKVAGDEELTPTDLERGQMLVSNQATLQQLFGRGGAQTMPERTRAMRAAEQISPGWTNQNYQVTQKARDAFTGGGQGAQSVASLNTILNHLGQLDQSASQMANTSAPAWNTLVNKARSNLLGNTPEAQALENYKTHALGVGSEIAKLLKGTGAASEQEINAWMQRFNENQSPKQMQENIKAAMELIGGRVNGLHNQYESAFGQPHGPFLTTQSQAIVRQLGRKYGFDTSTIDPGQATTPDVSQPTSTPRAQPTTTATQAPEITATNPKTGEKVVLRNGAWQPLK